MTSQNSQETLFKLIKEGKYKEFEDMINKKKLDVNIRDNLDNYLITYAIIKNNSKMVHVLVEKGSRLDIVDNEGRSLLFYAIRYGYLNILKKLLEYDKNSIGVSITDLKDKKGMIALHYATVFKDLKAVQILLEYGSDPNVVDKSGNNTLHYAIYNQNFEIVSEILKSNININNRTLTGENALHLAINFNMTKVASKLIDMGIEINAKDYDHEFSPLHYTITVDNIQIFQKLVDKGADLNLQDHLGYTVFHYICAMNKESFFDYLKKTNKTDLINVNIFNYENRIPIMLYLLQGTIKYGMFEYLVKNSNLNIQNFEGDSTMHILVDKNIWKKVPDILKTKKLNIFLKNSKGVRPVDLVSKDDLESFMEMVVDSYLYVIRRFSGSWGNEWENMCKEPLYKKSLGKTTLKKLEKVVTVNKIKGDDICRKIVRQKLDRLYNQKKYVCSDTSYPRKVGSRCLKLEADSRVEVCTFTGLALDILFGLIYLLKKYKYACSPIEKDVNLLVPCYNYGCEFLNFEILWSKGSLKTDDKIDETFNNCLEGKNRFILIPLGIELEKGSHANYIIYDDKLKEFERFEPYGSQGPYRFNYSAKMLDYSLSKLFKILKKDAKYVKPTEFLPKVGFQFFETVEAKTAKIGDPGGFCALWSIWYTDQRLTYPDVSRKSLVRKLIKQVRLMDISYKNLIRDYSKNITGVRDEVFKNVNISINDWINDNYSAEDLKTLVDETNKLISKYNS